MTALLLTKDLLFSSRVVGAAQRVGVELQTVSPDDLDRLGKISGEDVVRLAMIDLETVAGSLSTIISKLSECPSGRPVIVAYGPHVHHQRLAAAREAGCDEVLTRGQFNTEMDEILRRHCG